MADSLQFFEAIAQELKSGSIQTKDQLQRAKIRLSREFGLETIPGDAEVLNYTEFSAEVRDILRVKRTRTASGVSVVAVMTGPDRCPHGKCIFCPGGVENNSPQAYTGHEPAALRGRNNSYDPYAQVFSRLRQLETIGHDVSKVDAIVMGGTFTARPESYQIDFVKGCFDGMNRERTASLSESILVNEDAERRCIGLTVETKPDWFMEREIDLAISYGSTKVELGVQILNESVLRKNNRGHGIAEIVRSTQLARDAGFKIVYHIMPGMFGASADDDIRSFRTMISDPRFKPDMLKIYPTLVVKGTGLYSIWKRGDFIPMDSESAAELISKMLEEMPPWIRIQRMQRDIPVSFIEAGVKRSDLRVISEEKLKQRKASTMEIRAREIGFTNIDRMDFILKRLDYEASGGNEIYLSFENDDRVLLGFLRLRIPSEDAHRQEMIGSSVVREIKVFGETVGVGSRSGKNWQHRGFGELLLKEAERISAVEFGIGRQLVISGVGVRQYFRKKGYEMLGPYMCKSLP